MPPPIRVHLLASPLWLLAVALPANYTPASSTKAYPHVGLAIRVRANDECIDSAALCAVAVNAHILPHMQDEAVAELEELLFEQGSLVTA